MPIRQIATVLIFTLAVMAPPLAAWAGVAQWDFNGDLESATGQAALEEGAAAPADFPEVTFEDLPINGQTAQVAHFSRGTFFRLHPGFPPNGGGVYVNQYTLILDVMFPDRSPSGGWAALYQTNENNVNDGDWFVNPAGGLGVLGNYGGAIQNGDWHRLALVVNLVAGTYTSYLDGAQVQQNTGQGLDGRFSLYSVNDGAIDGFMLFADDNGDNAEGYVNSVQFRDVSMPASEIAKLGGPQVSGIPIPADPRDCTFRNFNVRYDAAANKVTGAWNPLPGEQGFRVFQGARQIGGDLPATATSFEDASPPLGGVDVIYTLKPLQNGQVERECPSNPVNTFGCLTQLACCANQAAKTVTLTWQPGKNIVVTGYEIKRDGAAVATVGRDDAAYTDTGIASIGLYQYEVALLSGGSAACSVSCKAMVTGVAIEGSGPCGGVVNQYDFNGNLASSAVGRDLIPRISPPIDPAAGGQPEVTFETVQIDGANAQVARYSRGTIFKMYTGLGANGGGEYTNQYTLFMDVLFEPGAIDESGWAALYQTNDQNGNDGDWFVRGSDRGLGIRGNYGGTVEDGVWHRLALLLDSLAGTFTSFIDGVQVQQNTREPIDGRFTLYTFNHGDSEGIFLFADNNAENSRGLVNSVQIRDVALSADEVAAFGGPSAAGIPFVPPCPYGLTCELDQSSRTAALSWKTGAGTGTGFTIRRNGQIIGSLPITATSFADGGLEPGVYKYEVSLNEKDSGCANLPLVCQVEVAVDFLFFENFDLMTSDADLAAAGWEARDEKGAVENAAWTIANPGHLRHPPSFNGRPASGRFASSNSDFGGSETVQNVPGSGMSHDLWTPSFSTAGAGPVWLHFDASVQLDNASVLLNDNGDAVFEVEVTTDGGASWKKILQRVSPGRTFDPLPAFGENADGLYGRVHLDLSAAAAGQPSVRLRFRHLEPTWDWWAAVDNILVDRKAPEGKETALAETDFAGGIPGTWKVVSGPGSDQADPWSADDNCSVSLLASGGVFPDLADGRQLHHLDSSFALADPFCSLARDDEYLLAPALELSRYRQVYLHVQSAILATDAARAEILLSLDGDGAFLEDPVFSYNLGGQSVPVEDPYYNEFAIPVPAAAGKANAVFAFHYESVGSGPGVGDTGTWWAIDKVRVTASLPEGGPIFRRGDAEPNGEINATDAIIILLYAFLGGSPGNCLEALDADADGNINQTDAIVDLYFAFLGSGSPAPPFPGCGLADTMKFGCESYDSSSCN